MKNLMFSFCRPASGIFIRTALLCLFFASGVLSAQQPFITTWKTNNTGQGNSTSIVIPTTGTGYNYEVDWNNDGVYEQTGITGSVSHNFGTAGTYTIRIRGSFPRIYCNSIGEFKLLDVVQWGDISWTSMNRAFSNCGNLNITATDVPNLSGVTDMSYMFYGCTKLTGPANIGSWDLSTVNNIQGMFIDCAMFNQPIGNWNTASVIDMGGIFARAVLFNQPIGNWNTSAVTDMGGMFDHASAFNQDISTWNTSAVTEMSSMFTYALAFNQPIGNWNTASVTGMNAMFKNATSFNQPIGNWSTAAVNNMGDMFFSATAFDQPIGNWNTTLVTSMSNMFREADHFNQPIGGWSTGAVTSMNAMFYGADAFNKPIGGWNTGAVTTMSQMFRGAVAFNQPIGGWSTGSVLAMDQMFYNATMFNQPIGNWNTGAVTVMSQMFGLASAFNQPIGGWNTAAVTNIGLMFYNAAAFNQSLATWTINPGNSMFTMLSNSGMDCFNYSATLIGWAGNPAIPSNRSLGADGRLYATEAASARTYLSSTKGWTITGDTPSGPNCAPVLPVEWVRFSGRRQDNSIVLDWETAREQHNLGFQVERSLDGVSWDALAFVPARNDASENQRYTYTDQDAARACPAACTLYYRLRQMDTDGGEDLSKMVGVAIGGLSGQPGIQVFPNPVQNGALTLFLPETISGTVNVCLLNSTGQTLRSATLETGTHVWDVSDLVPGIYTISGWSAAGQFCEKVMVGN